MHWRGCLTATAFKSITMERNHPEWDNRVLNNVNVHVLHILKRFLQVPSPVVLTIECQLSLFSMQHAWPQLTFHFTNAVISVRTHYSGKVLLAMNVLWNLRQHCSINLDVTCGLKGCSDSLFKSSSPIFLSPRPSWECPTFGGPIVSLNGGYAFRC